MFSKEIIGSEGCFKKVFTKSTVVHVFFFMNSCLFTFFVYIFISTIGQENSKNSRPKQLVKLKKKSQFRQIFFLNIFHKIQILLSENIQKKNNFREIDSSHFTSFLVSTFF
jgi:hypothetical protein